MATKFAYDENGLPYDPDEGVLPQPKPVDTSLPGDEEVSPNGVPMPPGSRVKAFAGGLARGAANVLKNASIEIGVQQQRSQQQFQDRPHGATYGSRTEEQKRGHFWQGTGREVFGGIGVNYDWRHFQQREIPEGRRVLSKAGTSQRGSQEGRNQAATEGANNGEYKAVSGAIQKPTWNEETGQGSFNFGDLKQPMPSRTQRDTAAAKPLFAQPQPTYQQPTLDLDAEPGGEPLWKKPTPMSKRPYQQSIPGTNV